MATTKIYDFDQVSLILGKILVDSGALDPDNGILVEYDSDRFVDVVGAGGEVARSKTNDARANVTFNLLQTSDSNDLLSIEHDLDLISPGGVGVFPLMINDRNGRTILVAEKAWILRSPNIALNSAPGFIEWIIRVGNLKPFIGGSTV